MTCDLLEGRLDGAEPAEIEAHMRECPACIAMAASKAEPGPGFTESVLARTSGSACGSARRHLCDLTDGLLAAGEAALVQMHLAHCPECAALASALPWSARLLPEMAEIDPGPAFTRRVLAVTTRRTPPARARGWKEGLRAWAIAVLERPRFSVEAAYAGAMVLWLIFGAGGSTLRAVPARALDLARIDPIEVVQATIVPAIPVEAISRLAAAPAAGARRAWGATGGYLIRSAARIAPTLPGRSAGVAKGALSLGGDTVQMLYATLGGDRATGEAAWNAMKEDLQSIEKAIAGSDNNATTTTRED